MKFYVTVFALAVFITAVPAYAQVGLDTAVSVEAQAGAGVSGNAGNASGTSTTKGNVETTWKVEEGESARESDEGEEGGTEDINIGVGEARAEGNVISVNAVEVRGWDAEQKQEFLATVKTHAQVQSEQDLENFAKGVVAVDENVETVATSDSEVRVSYRVPAKFLGIFEASIPAQVLVRANAEAEERVQVRFPWYKFLFSVEEETNESELQTAVESRVSAAMNANANANAAFALNDQARISQEVSAALKAEVDAAMSATGSVE